MSRWRRWLLSDWLAIRVQLALGAIFIFSGIAKIADPPGFAQEIHNYQLAPPWGVNLLALWLPWIELTAGLALVLGVWRRGAAAICAALLVVFIGALSINLARGHAVDCGCFGKAAKPKTDAERLADMRVVIARDVGMLAMAALVLARRPEESPR